MHPFNANGQKRGPSLERRIFLPRMVTLPTSKKTNYDGGYSVGLENPPSERWSSVDGNHQKWHMAHNNWCKDFLNQQYSRENWVYP